MDTTFETIDHDDLDLSPSHPTKRLRVRLSYDTDAECPLSWDHRDYRSKSRAIGDTEPPAVQFILFDDNSTLSDYHPYAYPSAVLARMSDYENRKRFRAYWLHGHTGRGSQGASFHTSKEPIRVTKTMISAMNEDEDRLRTEHDAIGFVIVDTTQVGKQSRRDERGRFIPLHAYWSEQASQQADLIERWCNGEFTGYEVEEGEIDPDTEEVEDWDHVDSCWGFDSEDYCREQALDAARSHWGAITKTQESEVADVIAS